MTYGLYRDGSAENERAYVQPTVPGVVEEFKWRATYEALGIQPPFDQLPTKEQYEAKHA